MPESPKNELIDQIRNLPEVDPPAGLSDRIMTTLSDHRRPLWRILLYRWSRPRTITIRPLKWAAVGTAAVALMIVVSLSRTPQRPASSLTQTLAYLDSDAKIHHMLGRELLAKNKAQEAMVHLRRAVDIQPDDANYHFWLGVNYWALEEFDQELAYYQTALQIDPNLLPAHAYIGHNYLDRGDWERALYHYGRVLEDAPRHAGALFNRGLALRYLGDTPMENEAWRAYLTHYNRGERAMRAVDFLNANGDFSFRQIQLGPLRMVKQRIQFDRNQTTLIETDRATLNDIGQILARNRKLQLHVVAYVDNDADLAKRRARAVKRYLRDNFEGLSSQRIKLSWFGVPESVSFADRTYRLDDAVRIFTTRVDES